MAQGFDGCPLCSLDSHFMYFSNAQTHTHASSRELQFTHFNLNLALISKYKSFEKRSHDVYALDGMQ